MAKTDFRSRARCMALSEAGSVKISAALLGIVLVCAALIAVLGAVGLIDAPPLIYLLLAVIVLAAGWDLWRESRKDGDR